MRGGARGRGGRRNVRGGRPGGGGGARAARGAARMRRGRGHGVLTAPVAVITDPGGPAPARGKGGRR
ncbi:hypothetical protein FNV60_52490 [Streptomyces sp. RLB3-5]|nr:hypothetical protein FNV60_52490 [Streptomyces sp. RLB3-5]